MIVSIELRSQYGRTVAHPANDAAQALADIAGTKTLTPETLRIARDRLSARIEVHNTSQASYVAFMESR